MNLADIVQGNWLKEFAAATPATVATPEKGGEQRVATVAVAHVAEDKSSTPIDPFLVRCDWLERAGLDADGAALMAFRLERRDLQQDERRLCVECRHLSRAAGSWLCGQWRQHHQASPHMPSDLVTVVLHRCAGFGDRTEG